MTKPILLSLTLLLFCACNNPCKDVSCNNGDCFGEGECECNQGYEGENCDVTLNSKFEGTYSMIELCDSSTALPAYNVVVLPKPGSTNLIILGGLRGISNTIEAQIEPDGVEFGFNRQVLDGGHEIESITGTISSDANTINVNYKIFDGSSDLVLDRCSGSMQK